LIDIENQIITALNTALSERYPNLKVSSEDLPTEATFPYVYMTEGDNAIKLSTMDSSGREKYAKVMYEIKVYSNKAVGKRTEAKTIFEILNDKFHELGFIRKTKLNSTINDGSVAYYVGRFEAVVSENKTIYWR
jgi:hypothetical protein